MKIYLPTILGLLVFTGIPGHCAPNITDVSFSGNFSDYPNDSSGKLMTITLTGGGTKATPQPAVWATFEGSSNPTTLGYRRTWTVMENASTTTAQAYGGTFSLGSTNLSSVSSTIFRVRVDTTTDAVGRGGWMLAAWKRKSLYTYTDLNEKWYRIWDSNGGGGGGSQYPNMYWSTQGATKSSRLLSLELVPDPSKTKSIQQVYPHPGQTPNHAWRTEMYLVQVNSSTGAVDGQALSYVFLPSSGSFFMSSTTWQTDSVNAPGIFDQMSIQTDLSSGLTDGEEFFDDVYCDYTPARIMLSDSNTFVGANTSNTLMNLQVPLTWSDTSITAYINTSGFTNNASAYLYVCDSSNACNASGFAITIGVPAFGSASQQTNSYNGIQMRGVGGR